MPSGGPSPRLLLGSTRPRPHVRALRRRLIPTLFRRTHIRATRRPVMGFYPDSALDPVPIQFLRMPDIFVAVRHHIFHLVAA